MKKTEDRPEGVDIQERASVKGKFVGRTASTNKTESTARTRAPPGVGGGYRVEVLRGRIHWRAYR